jgi:sugar lactone lactonase YvrE
MKQVERLLPSSNVLGEGPRWNSDEQTLYWTDIRANALFRFHPESGKQEHWALDLSVNCFAFRETGGLVLATPKGFAFGDWQKKQVEVFANPLPNNPQVRFNDGAVDSKGRFWVGSLGMDGANALYRLGPDHYVRVMDAGFRLPNGIGWSPDDRTMYFTDSRACVIYAYDFDTSQGTIANRRVWARIPEENGLPDGLCVDREGFVWSARWGGWKIVRYDPAGRVYCEFKTPIQYPTSCVFGHSNLDWLYVTSARASYSEDQIKNYPMAGDLFCLQTETQGLMGNLFKG